MYGGRLGPVGRRENTRDNQENDDKPETKQSTHLVAPFHPSYVSHKTTEMMIELGGILHETFHFVEIHVHFNLMKVQFSRALPFFNL